MIQVLNYKTILQYKLSADLIVNKPLVFAEMIFGNPVTRRFIFVVFGVVNSIVN